MLNLDTNGAILADDWNYFEKKWFFKYLSLSTILNI